MSDNFPIGCMAVIIGALVIGGGGVTIAANLHEEQKTCTITNKESISKGENGHEYRVFTEECGVLTASDNLLRWHFNAADIYGDLDIGSTYDVTTTGWRVPFLSWMPNVVEARPAQ